MSSKGRKPVEQEEFYPTPPEVVDALLESKLVDLPGGWWIEPCAGAGNIIKAVNRQRTDVHWIACELQERFEDSLQAMMRPKDVLLPFGDFVHREWQYEDAEVLIMNPPFSLTMQFVQAALGRARWVACIQRQGWFGTAARARWLSQHCPDMLQIPWRPSFRPDGQTDSCEYVWFIWPPGEEARNRRFGRIAMLDYPLSRQPTLFGTNR